MAHWASRAGFVAAYRFCFLCNCVVTEPAASHVADDNHKQKHQAAAVQEARLIQEHGRCNFCSFPCANESDSRSHGLDPDHQANATLAWMHKYQSKVLQVRQQHQQQKKDSQKRASQQQQQQQQQQSHPNSASVAPARLSGAEADAVDIHHTGHCAICNVPVVDHALAAARLHVNGAKHTKQKKRQAQQRPQPPQQQQQKHQFHAAPVAPAPDTDLEDEAAAILETGRCKLCDVQVGDRTPQGANDHVRGANHRTQKKLRAAAAAANSTDPAGFSAKLSTLGREQNGVSITLLVDGRVLESDGVLALEVGATARKVCFVITSKRAVELRNVLGHRPVELSQIGLRFAGLQRLLKPGRTELQFSVRAESLGLVGMHPSFVVFRFRNALLLHQFRVHVIPAGSAEAMAAAVAHAEANPYKKPTKHEGRVEKERFVKRGEAPPSIALAQTMYVVPLGYFDLPKRFPPKESIGALLEQPLRASNYAAKFKMLLHLEERQMVSDITDYDRKASFTVDPRRPSYLFLRVAGLAEARPSVQRGDSILVASEPFSESYAPGRPRSRVKAWEGRVHAVEQEQVLLKFDPVFHRLYIPKQEMFVRFTFNRIPLRRQHQGIKELAENGAAARLVLDLDGPERSASATAAASAASAAPRMEIVVTDSAERCNEWVDEAVLSRGVRAVGLDTESSLFGELAVVQIATANSALVFRVLGLKSDELPEKLVRLLGSFAVCKFSVGDEANLAKQYAASQCVLVHHVDVQRKDMQRTGQKIKPGTQVLADKYVPELGFIKNKALQVSDWKRWPLSVEQEEYAANDAIIALAIGQAMAAPPAAAAAAAAATNDGAHSSGGGGMFRQALSWVVGLAIAPRAAARPTAAAAAAASEPAVDPNQLPELNFRRSFNEQQQLAIRSIVHGAYHPTPFVLFGPPGTGKTTVLVEAIQQLLSRDKPNALDRPGVRILAVAPSNSAADLFVERLSVSVGSREMLRLNAISRVVADTPEVVRRYSKTDPTGTTFVLQELTALLQYRVIVTTAISGACLHSLGMKAGHFTHIFVDEAGHATEPECAAALGGLIDAQQTRVVLGGDPQQLGPIIRSPAASKLLGVSLLERLILDADRLPRSPYHRPSASGPYPSRFAVKLLHNYRSHPAILTVPNRLFYNNELIPSADVLERQALCSWSGWPNGNKNFPVLMHHVAGEERQEERSPSWFNLDEVQLVLHQIRSLLEEQRFGLLPADIGVVTPYSRQAQHIRAALRDSKQQRLFPVNKRDGLAQLKVGSTEEFQGQERRVIIVSTVRSQLATLRDFDVKFALGFVNQPKRLNVALTRAKQALIVIGNAAVLETDGNWRAYIQHCADNKALVGNPRLKHVITAQPASASASAAAAAAVGESAAATDDAELAKMAEAYEEQQTEEALRSKADDGDDDSEGSYDDTDAPLPRNTEAKWNEER